MDNFKHKLSEISFTPAIAKHIIGINFLEDEILHQTRLYRDVSLMDIYNADGKIGNMFHRWLDATTTAEVYDDLACRLEWTENNDDISMFQHFTVYWQEDSDMVLTTSNIPTAKMTKEYVTKSERHFNWAGTLQEEYVTYNTGKLVHRKIHYRKSAPFNLVTMTITEGGITETFTDRMTHKNIRPGLTQYHFMTDRPDATDPSITCNVHDTPFGTHRHYVDCKFPYFESYDSKGNMMMRVGGRHNMKKSYVFYDTHSHLKRMINDSYSQTWYYETTTDQRVTEIGYRIKEHDSPRDSKSTLIALNKIL